MTNNALGLYDNFDQTVRIAKALSSSDLVPDHFKKKPENVLIALEFAYRNDVSPFVAMQSIFVVHGKVGMLATMAIALAKKSGCWKSFTYQSKGSGDSLEVTAVALDNNDKELTTTVNMRMANDAGWTKNPIWRSIPEQMLKYRAAVFLIRSHFPEVLFGMQTVEEIKDVEAINTINTQKQNQPKKKETILAIDEVVNEVAEVVDQVETFEPKNSFQKAKDDLRAICDLHFDGKPRDQVFARIDAAKDYEALDKVQTIVASYVRQKQLKAELKTEPAKPE